MRVGPLDGIELSAVNCRMLFLRLDSMKEELDPFACLYSKVILVLSESMDIALPTVGLDLLFSDDVQ